MNLQMLQCLMSSRFCQQPPGTDRSYPNIRWRMCVTFETCWVHTWAL